MEHLQKIPIKGFIETSFVDWHSKICSVIFFPRCNFRCRYCHNADLVLHPDALENVGFDTITKRLAELKGWVDGVCVTGGEPTLSPHLSDVLAAVKKQGFLTKLDTNGSNPERLQHLIQDGLVDYVAMDIKSSLDERSYCRITQTPNMLESVKKSIRILLSGQVEHEFRCTVLPSFHGAEDIYRIAQELNGAARLRIQNFNPSSTILDQSLCSLQPYSDEDITIIQARVDELISMH